MWQSALRPRALRSLIAGSTPICSSGFRIKQGCSRITAGKLAQRRMIREGKEECLRLHHAIILQVRDSVGGDVCILRLNLRNQEGGYDL